MNYDKVIDGITRYIDREIMPGMNEWQEVLARIAVSRFVDNKSLKDTLMHNPFVKTFAIMDCDGNVDVEGLRNDLKNQIDHKGKIDISIPMFGKFTFTSEDIDKLYNTIMERGNEIY